MPQEINAAAEVVYEAVDADANIIFGALIDDKITTGEVSDQFYVFMCVFICVFMYAFNHTFMSVRT